MKKEEGRRRERGMGEKDERRGRDRRRKRRRGGEAEGVRKVEKAHSRLA